MSNNQLPDDVQERIKADAIKSYPIPVKFSDQIACMERREGYIAGATEYTTKLHEAQQDNEQLKRWKMEAAELLTKINAYAHKHLEIKLGQCAVEFVIGRAKEHDELKQENEKLKGLLNKQLTTEQELLQAAGASWEREKQLKERCEKMEAALKEILKQHDYYSVIELADKALKEGESNTLAPGEGEISPK